MTVLKTKKSIMIFKNINGLIIPKLNFKDLPDYETTEEDEEDDGKHEENSKSIDYPNS
jgi:hypothetical protein